MHKVDPKANHLPGEVHPVHVHGSGRWT